MEDIRQILSDNLTKLRKANNYTQIELANKLGFTDKAVSKWEQGDTVPDIETLKRLSDLYHVSIDSLLDESPIETKVNTKEKNKIITNKIIITLLSITLVWATSLILFTLGVLGTEPTYQWKLFIWSLPVTFVVILIFNSVWGRARYNYAISSVLMWTLLLAFHLQLNRDFMWMIYLLGIPGQIAIVLASQLTVSRKTEKPQKEPKIKEPKVKKEKAKKLESNKPNNN